MWGKGGASVNVPLYGNGLKFAQARLSPPTLDKLLEKLRYILHNLILKKFPKNM